MNPLCRVSTILVKLGNFERPAQTIVCIWNIHLNSLCNFKNVHLSTTFSEGIVLWAKITIIWHNVEYINQQLGVYDKYINLRPQTSFTVPRSTASGTSHISKIEKLGSCTHEKSDSYQIWYLGLYTNSKCHCRKWSWSVDRIWYLPYKSNSHLNIF